jgi:hypothetical protein
MISYQTLDPPFEAIHVALDVVQLIALAAVSETSALRPVPRVARSLGSPVQLFAHIPTAQRNCWQVRLSGWA